MAESNSERKLIGKPKYITENHNHDGIDRRGFLECMAWAGTGLLCLMQGGVLRSYPLSEVTRDQIEGLHSESREGTCRHARTCTREGRAPT